MTKAPGFIHLGSSLAAELLVARVIASSEAALAAARSVCSFATEHALATFTELEGSAAMPFDADAASPSVLASGVAESSLAPVAADAAACAAAAASALALVAATSATVRIASHHATVAGNWVGRQWMRPRRAPISSHKKLETSGLGSLAPVAARIYPMKRTTCFNAGRATAAAFWC